MAFTGPGTYKILSALATGRTVDLDTKTLGKPETRVQIFFENDGADQRWVFSNANDEAFTISLQNRNKYIQPEGQQHGAGKELVGTDANGSNYQKWIVENLGNELYRLRNVGSQRYMMVDSSDPGDQLEQDDYENKANYHWILRPTA